MGQIVHQGMCALHAAAKQPPCTAPPQHPCVHGPQLLRTDCALTCLPACAGPPPIHTHKQAAGSPVRPLDGFSSAEEAAQYLELEREVAEMQAMLEEATAAAERGAQSTSDQQYLSEILGE